MIPTEDGTGRNITLLALISECRYLEGFTKEEFMAWTSPDFPKSEKFRVIYENEEIGVTHEFLSFQSGKEAVLCAWSIKNGKIIRIETGATPISS